MADRAEGLNFETTEAPGDGGPREAAHYIRDALPELAAMARTHRLETLSHLLNMALQEAHEAMSREATRPG